MAKTPTTHQGARWKSPVAGAVLIFLITVAAYLPVLRGEFVFDDGLLITDNRIIKAGDGLHRFWFTTEAPDYYPLTWSLWWLEWRLWGDNATGYHAVNLVLHAANAILVWMVLRRLKVPGAWFAALIFAIHPVNAATVAWISEQKNTLSMLFYALAILLYLRFVGENRWCWYALSLAAFLLALLSKSAVVMLPFVLLGCVWWLHGAVRRRDLLCAAPFFVLSLVFGLVTIWFQYNRAMGGQAVRVDGFLSRLATAGLVPWFYVYKVLLPFNLMVIYPEWKNDASRWASYLPGTILIICLVVSWRNRRTWGRPLLFGLGYFVVTLFPVLGFLDQGFYQHALVADHWLYYSIIGVIALVVGVGATIGRRASEPGRSLGVLACVAMLMMLGMAAWTRASVYQTSETLWDDTVAKNPKAWLALYNLGNLRSRHGDMQRAIEWYQQALVYKPDYADAHVNLGDSLLRVGRVQEAIDQYRRALQIQPRKADVHNNLGFALFQAGKREEAIGHYEQALQIDPDFAAAHYNLGNAFLEAGKIQDAVGHYEQAVRINPDYADAHNNLAFALLQEGKIQEAIGHCEQALRVRPEYAEAHYNLGNALQQQGKIKEAIAHYKEALRLKPDFAEARNQLALLPVVP